ncbi:response regulator [Rubrolithibacter danxiaensis]|uniref:response regulator n=1 Tax=Rubrolithibacter danxiaensis TaxID=3390805 RepID=UPI003BF7CC8A
MEKRILVIEDDTDILSLIQTILETEGYTVIPSTNSTPLSSLDELHPNLILLDHFLGNSLGHTICKELKEDPDSVDIPVILISGAADLQEIAGSCNADSFIKKPFDIDEVINKVKEYAC